VDLISAWNCVLDPTTDAKTLAAIAEAEPECRTAITMHANTHLDLLDWLDAHGDEPVKHAVAARRARPVLAEASITPSVTDANSPASISLVSAIKSWSSEFSDGANDDDIDLWVRQSLDTFGPVLLFGQENNGILMPPVLQPNEMVTDAWPCYIDDDPDQKPTPIGARAKCRGFWRNGLMAVTADHLLIAHETDRPWITTYYLPLARIVEIAPVDFTFSAQTMPNAGDGFELFFGPSIKLLRRLLFRFALSSIDLDLSPLAGPAN